MRIYDTEIKLQTTAGSVEIWEYHDEHKEFIGPPHWHARVVVIEDGGIDVININRDSQQELYKALESIKDLFETATTAVLDAATI